VGDRLGRKLRIEVGCATLSASLFALTLVFPEWIEAVFGLDPDGGSGAAEFMAAAILLLAAVVSAALARRDFRVRLLLRDPS